MTLSYTFANDGGVDTDGRLAVFGPPGRFTHTGYKATMEMYTSTDRPGLFAGYGVGTSFDLHFNRARGTVTSPTYPKTGDRMMAIAGRAFDESTGDFNTSSLAITSYLLADAGPGTPTPCDLRFEQTKVGATGRSVAMSLTNGNLEIGCLGSGYRLCVQGEGSQITYAILNSAGDTMFYSATANATVYGGENQSAYGVMQVRKRDNGRSINCAGTVNTGGSDYAEYERKAQGCGEIAKGDIVGFDADGKLTDRWRDAVSFGVKSTSPSFVGGDSWGFDPDADRTPYDRIAYCGKVPVNVWHCRPGDYIIPARGPRGSIIGKPVLWKLWRKPVGRVRRILPDGRAEIAVPG